MVDRVEVRVTGVGPVARDLGKLAADVGNLPMAGIADEAVRILRGFTPVRSGRLAGSSRPLVDQNNQLAGATQGGGPILYAGPINYGWRRHNIRPARQFERTAERLEPAAERQLDRAVTDAIQKRGLT